MIRFAVPLALVVAWWGATSTGWLKSYQFASPRDVIREVIEAKNGSSAKAGRN